MNKTMRQVMLAAVALAMVASSVGSAQAISPQPEPPLRHLGYNRLGPQPEPPDSFLKYRAINPQPEPPGSNFYHRGFNPQPEPPAIHYRPHRVQPRLGWRAPMTGTRFRGHAPARVLFRGHRR
jgi:hypothetical protein